MGIRKELLTGEEIGMGKKDEKEGLIIQQINIENEKWKIVGVYVNKGMKEKSEEIRDLIEGNKDKVKLLIGDFNARTENKGGKE